MSETNNYPMTSTRKNVQRLAQDVFGNARKRKQISRCMKKNGLRSLGKGGWLAFRGVDVVSGFLIEGSPLDTYITSFVLPSFDRQTFISWSLGRRIISCSLDVDTETECNEAISFYKNNLISIRTSSDLLSYIESENIAGHYPIWVRYLCLLRNQRFEDGEKWLDADKLVNMHHVVREQFSEIAPYVIGRDAQGVAMILEDWEKISEKIFGPFQQEFCAFK